MIWLGLGIAIAGYFVGCGMEAIGTALAGGFKLLAETEIE